MRNRPTQSTVLAALAIALLAPMSWAQDAIEARTTTDVIFQPPQAQPVVQLAILLDTSNSMDGLIHQAKTQLWRMVNQFIAVRRDGRRPRLYVALYEYGNNGLTAESGHIRRVLPLTDDLDRVSQELFALSTNGGHEFCGQVIERAVAQLAWSNNPDDYRAIFIAGNEPFTQGPMDYRSSCRAAIARGITVNTIHCGTFGDGVNGHWKTGALLADGKYLNIDQNKVSAPIDAPQDPIMLQLNERLNDTYVPYGRRGRAGKMNQIAQDRNAESAGVSNLAMRAATKQSHLYCNDSWDLCDAVQNGRVKLEQVKAADLPEPMKKMTVEQRRTYIEQQLARRAQIKEQLARISAQREQHVSAEMRKRAETGEDSLDEAVIKVVREQAAQKRFKFE